MTEITLTLAADGSRFSIESSVQEEVPVPEVVLRWQHSADTTLSPQAVLNFLQGIEFDRTEITTWRHVDIKGLDDHCSYGGYHYCSLENMIVFVRGVLQSSKYAYNPEAQPKD